MIETAAIVATSTAQESEGHHSSGRLRLISLLRGCADLLFCFRRWIRQQKCSTGRKLGALTPAGCQTGNSTAALHPLPCAKHAAGTAFVQRQSANNKDLVSEDLVQVVRGSIAKPIDERKHLQAREELMFNVLKVMADNRIDAIVTNRSNFNRSYSAGVRTLPIPAFQQ